MRVLALCLLVACSPGPAPMPDGGGGGSGSCGAAKTPPNLLQNGGFECGDGHEWGAQFGTFALASVAHGGQHSGQLTASSSGAGQLQYEAAVVASTSGKTYCVNGWFRGPDARIEVLPAMSGVAQTFSSPMSADWLRAPPTTNLAVQVNAGDSLYLRIKLLNGHAGDVLFVDDVDFWESASGKCDEGR